MLRYPIAFIEFIERDGEKFQEGPRTENEEAIAEDMWRRQREKEASKLRDDFEKRLRLYENLADKFEGRAGLRWTPGADDACAPDDTEDLWLNYIENPGAPLGDEWLRMTPYTAGWLARHARDYIGKERERMHEEIARDLEINYPSRNVRNFRVIVVKDSRWVKREPLRRAQITIWDVLNITHTEGGKAGHFEEGQRFLATNLQPTQQAAWMAPGVDSVIYMSSRRDSRWTKLKN